MPSGSTRPPGEGAAFERRTAAPRSRRRARGRVAPGVLVVLQRDPVFVVGGGNFIEEMLELLGARNLASGFESPYPRVAAEWVVARAPDVLIDLSPDQVASIVAFLGSLTGEVDQVYIEQPGLPGGGPDTPAPDPS